jgi:hypothetical protein
MTWGTIMIFPLNDGSYYHIGSAQITGQQLIIEANKKIKQDETEID